jgi:hypothetical protein
LTRREALAPFTTAVSLHAHTRYSREVMALIPSYLDRIPVVAPLARREMQAYARRHGRPIDFSKGWWNPPVEPGEVVASESEQIAGTLGLAPIVSITDHDTIEATRRTPCRFLVSGRFPSAAVSSISASTISRPRAPFRSSAS